VHPVKKSSFHATPDGITSGQEKLPERRQRPFNDARFHSVAKSDIPFALSPKHHPTGSMPEEAA
jgi:hypothetical protein